jgi:hypothetical protein
MKHRVILRRCNISVAFGALLAMPTDGTSFPQDGPTCAKCGGSTALITLLPRFGEQPAYWLFECRKCRAMTWIEQTDKK